jgi:peptide/nickel transport system permease protein
MSLSPGELEVVVAGDGLGGEPQAPAAIQGRSLWAIAWRRLRRNKVAMVAGVYVVVLILIAIFADVLTGLYGHTYLDTNNLGSHSLLNGETQLPKGPLGGISAQHWLGVTPVEGRDIVSLLMYGARTSLIISGLATALSVVLGVLLGLAAGFFRGWADIVISRVMDVLLSFPTLLFSISLVSVTALITSAPITRYVVIIFVLGFFGWPYIGRIVRGQVLSLREKEFVDAARSLGASNTWIMLREIAPNIVGPILVYTTLTIPNNILGEAGLSFLGVGVYFPAVSWGQMLSDAGNYYPVDPMYLVIPGAALFLSVLAFNLFGDGLRDALDPKSSR